MSVKYPLARGLKEMGEWGHNPDGYAPNGVTKCRKPGCKAQIRCENWDVVFSQFRQKCPATNYT